MSGEGGGFVGDSLHHVSVPTKRIDVVIKEREAATVKVSRHPRFGNGHPHAGGHTLT